MDTICVYKDKLNEALTLVPCMSQAKKLEAVTFWNNAASHFQQIVNDDSSIQDQPPQLSNSTGQNSSLDYNQQASDVNPTVILDPGDFGAALPEQTNHAQTAPDNTIADDLSVSKTTTALIQRQDSIMDRSLFDSDYLLPSIIGDMQQISSASIDDDTDPLTLRGSSALAKKAAHPAYTSNSIPMIQDCASDCSIAAMGACADSDQQYLSSVRTTSDIAMNNIAPGTSTSGGALVGHSGVHIDDQIPCTMMDGTDQALSTRSVPIEIPNSIDQLRNQTHSSSLKVGMMQADMAHFTRQTTIHDIGNGQYDRGPGHGLSRDQTQTSLRPPAPISNQAFVSNSCSMNPTKNDSYTHGIRPLQQIQILRRPTSESNYDVCGKLKIDSLPPGQQRVNDPIVQQRFVLITSSALSAAACSSSHTYVSSQQAGIKLEGMTFPKSTSEQHTCELCGKSGFSTKGNLKRHRKAHAGEKPYQCEHCYSKFTEKKSLKIHLRKHTGEKPYKCHICDKHFSQTGVLKSHMALHNEERKFNCDKCDKAFRQRSQLKLHLMRHDGIKKLECSECRAKFLTKGDLERHFRTHTGERPYACEICRKTFTRQQSLNEHINRHVGRKPFNCKHCDKSFSEMSACYKHAKIHKKDELVQQQSG